MRRLLALLAVMATIAGLGSAFAVSDGGYTPRAMHCSGAADNVESPARAEPGCHHATVTVSDVGGHEYFGIGSPQTADREKGPVPAILPFGLLSNVHQADFWVDPGDECTRVLVDFYPAQTQQTGACPWFDESAPNYYGPDVAPNPASGLTIYFGFDDNAAGGEHDSSELINNGPSDGGSIHVTLDPASVMPWVMAFVENHPEYVARHPLPAGDAGAGFCADGICISAQTQRQVAYQGGGEGERDVSNYDGHTWDPDSCSGETDGSNGTQCDDANEPGTQNITWWHNQYGTAYVEPGVQIYEDPDPQGSPIGNYPIPALYIGTCGVIIGGGDFDLTGMPFTNDSGQMVIGTIC